MIPKNYVLKYERKVISKKVDEVAKKLNKYIKDNHYEDKSIIIMPILTGALFFASDFIKKLNFKSEIECIRVSSYDKNTRRAGVKIIGKNKGFKNKVVILMDDICDSGHTLKCLSEYLAKNGAFETISVVCIDRKVDDKVHNPNFSCIKDKSKSWFVGYGMDDCQLWRQFPDIYVIK